ncbi:MAG: methyltransferase domain-containing protein [bacterium]|nr:methyltransferase domain-containing protein [bacterium]
MIFQTVKNLITSKDLSAQFKMAGIMKLEGSLIFYHAGIETGLFKTLAEPATLEELANRLNISNKQLLSSLLDLGCSVKEIACRNGKYRLKGAMAKALVNNVPIAELLRETVQYHGDVACRLDTYLLKNKKGNYLKDFGGVIAESSRLAEPLIKAFIYRTIKKSTPLTILEFGCGSGEYLRHYVDINRNNSGAAIDKDASAVAIAREKTKENNIENNFTVMQDNIIKPETLKGKSFDLITSYSNIYYFSDDERKKLFTSVNALLKDKGRFMLATAMKTRGLSSSYYDLIFSATEALYPLPRLNDIETDLKKCGFTRVKIVNLLGKSFLGVVAYK